jgi:sulfite exporter TauE/SafE
MSRITALFALCHAALGPSHLALALPVVLFLAGVLGSMVHCVPMCGAFVLAQASDCMACLPAQRLTERNRIIAGALPFYHLGRLTTYTALGAVAGAFTASLARGGLLPGLSGVLLLAAALLLLLQGLKNWFPVAALPGAQALWRLMRPLAQSLRGSGPGHRYATGVLLGFLPCGMLGAALLTAASAGTPLGSALAMAGFALGTMPALALLGILGGRGLALYLRPSIPWLYMMSALILGSIGWAEL